MRSMGYFKLVLKYVSVDIQFLVALSGPCGNAIKIRKNVKDLMEGERKALVSAMKDIIEDGTFGHIANFHGGPLTICNPVKNGRWAHPLGCCPHGGSNTDFVTWHRLYLATMEKVSSFS